LCALLGMQTLPLSARMVNNLKTIRLTRVRPTPIKTARERIAT